LSVKAASQINASNVSKIQIENIIESAKSGHIRQLWTGYSLFYLKYLSFALPFAVGSNELFFLSFLIGVPLDTIRRNIVATQGQSNLPYKGPLQCAQYLVQNHGYGSLYRGFYLYPELYAALIVLSYLKRE
jgi:hypothetical protein